MLKAVAHWFAMPPKDQPIRDRVWQVVVHQRPAGMYLVAFSQSVYRPHSFTRNRSSEYRTSGCTLRLDKVFFNCDYSLHSYINHCPFFPQKMQCNKSHVQTLLKDWMTWRLKRWKSSYKELKDLWMWTRCDRGDVPVTSSGRKLRNSRTFIDQQTHKEWQDGNVVEWEEIVWKRTGFTFRRELCSLSSFLFDLD